MILLNRVRNLGGFVSYMATNSPNLLTENSQLVDLYINNLFLGVVLLVLCVIQFLQERGVFLVPRVLIAQLIVLESLVLILSHAC